MTILNRVERPVVLLIEEHDDCRAFLGDNLTADGFAVVATHDAEEGLRLAREHRPDVALVAVNGGSGRDFARVVRAGDAGQERRLPMILLGGDNHELDTLRALDAGADDYVPKPIVYPVLYARVRALLRRVELDRQPRRRTLTCEGLSLDLATRECRLDGEPVDLTKKGFLMLQTLMSDPGRVWTKQELAALMMLRTRGGRAGDRALDSHACRLRSSLGVAGWIASARGVGYRLRTPAPAEAVTA